MKRLLLLLSLLTSCDTSGNLPQGITELDRKHSVDGVRVDVYYGVPGFQTQDSTAWAHLHETVSLSEDLRPEKGVLLVHFLDTTAFSIPTNGLMYGGKSAMNRVITQCTVLPNGDHNYNNDPSGSGRYVEPKL